MESSSGESRQHVEQSEGTQPAQLHPRTPYAVVGEVLDEGTAAQIIRAYGETEIQVNDAIPSRLWITVALHTFDNHGNGCYAQNCVAARGWLRGPSLRLLVTPATA